MILAKFIKQYNNLLGKSKISLSIHLGHIRRKGAADQPCGGDG